MKLWKGHRVLVLNTIKKPYKEYMNAVDIVSKAASRGIKRAKSGISSISLFVRLPYWHHIAMVVLGACHLLLHNTTKWFLKAISQISN